MIQTAGKQSHEFELFAIAVGKLDEFAAFRDGIAHSQLESQHR